jgi:hypothetical protein
MDRGFGVRNQFNNYTMTDRQKELLEEMRNALILFRNSHSALTEIFVDGDFDTIELNDLIDENYPFQESFDEMSGGIKKWVDSSLKQINNYLEEKHVAKSVFSITDNLEKFEGYTFGELWNGWACPLFTFEVAEQIRLSSVNEDFVLTYDKNSDTYSVDGDICTPLEIEYEGQKFKVYGIGAYGWTWWDEQWNDR